MSLRNPSFLRRRVLMAFAALAAWPARAQQPAPTAAGAAPAPAPATPAAPAGPVLTGPIVEVTTKEGVISIQMASDQAPITTGNFLRYVDQKRYDGSNFYRASRAINAPQYGVIQGGLQNDPKKILKAIAHESTTKTGLKHVDGTISLARNAPGTATSDFFICVGPSSYLDAKPEDSGDNEGFAVFGQVVAGMDVVKKILALPTDAPARNPAMQGQMLSPPVTIVTMRRAKPAA